MTDASLTTRQRDLLQRWFDGELAEDRVPEAEALIEESQAAADYVASLESMQRITRGLADEVRGGPGWSAEETVSKALDAPPAADEPLRELAPLLERYHDGEVVEAEAALVRRLRRRRDDVADYLKGLEQLGDAVRGADEASRDGIDFDAQVHAVLEAVDSQPPTFDADEHAEWLHRYADDELDAERRQIVEGWVDEGHPEVTDALKTLDALGQTTRAAFDQAGGHNIELWDAVADAIDDEEEESGGSAEVFRLDDYRQGIAGAVAAALVLITVGALFGDRLFPWGERVVEKKTVVIVDSVEHSEGSSVLIDSPMQEAGASESADDPKKATKKADDEASEDKPTVIWLLDSDENKDDAESGGTEDGSDQQDKDRAPDAGADDADQPPSGQPI